MINKKTKSVGDEVLNRIINNKPYDRNLKIYDKEFLLKIIKYFESTEEFEKCQIITNFLGDRYDHSQNYVIKLKQ